MRDHHQFTILTIGHFSFSRPEHQEVVRNFPGMVEDRLPPAEISLSIPMEKRICEEGCLDLFFQHPADFSLNAIVHNNDWLLRLQSAADYITAAESEAQTAAAIYQKLTAWENLPLRFTPPKPADGEPVPADPDSSQLDEILNMVDQPGALSDAPEAGPHAWKSAINDLLQKNLAAVFSDPEFIKTESAWRGLSLLAENCAGDDGLFLQTLSISQTALDDLSGILRRDFSRQSPHLILLDFEFDNTPRSLDIIESVAAVCEEFLVPAVIAMNEKFLHLNSWDELSSLPYLPHYMDASRFAAWKRFAASAAGNWLAAACISFQGHNPADTKPAPGAADKSPVLLSSVWALGALCAQSIQACGWPARFTDNVRFCLKNSTPLFEISNEKKAGFIKAGLLPLSGDKGGRKVYFQE